MIENKSSQSKTERHVTQILNKLEALRNEPGTSEQYWLIFLESAAKLCRAQSALLVIQSSNGDSWQVLRAWPLENQSQQDLNNISSRLTKVAERATQTTCTIESRSFVATHKDKRTLCAVCLPSEEKDQPASVLILLLPPSVQIDPDFLITALRLMANLPLITTHAKHVEQAHQDMMHCTQTLELTASLNHKTRYLAACMTLCNQIASLYACARVSLGWHSRHYIRLQAMSHVERFEKKMEAVQSLEAAMEEAFDQDQEIIFPPDQKTRSIFKAHETFSRKFGSSHVLSLPIRLESQPIGILTCERSEQGFSEDEVRGLALICDQTGRRLQDLKDQDVWFGHKLAKYCKQKAGSVLGVEHTLAKLVSILISCLLAVLIFGHWTYRVEAPFTLKAEKLAFITAPYEGYIQDIFVETGDKIPKDFILLTLNTEEMVLQETQTLADLQHNARKAKKARANNKLADTKIALAKVDQSKAKLQQIRYNIEHARVRTPFAGIVVQGEKEELLGRPVHKGDVLFKVARLKGMYAEIQVNEKDIHEVGAQATGEIAFASRPDLTFPIQVSKINPMAKTQKKQNVFSTEAELTDKPRPWWRPGMSGLAKINAGKRSLLWILTHRTIDFFRMLFWW